MGSHSDDLTLALELADLADSITMARFRAEDLRVETKADRSPVTEADQAVEEAIRQRLSHERPDDGVLGEEHGSSQEVSGDRRWIVDPIDGTKGFVRGFPTWGTLIALEERGEITLGVASAPALPRRWWASRGNGAFVRERPGHEPRRLRVSGVTRIEDAQLCYGGLGEWVKIGKLDALMELAKRCWRTRAFGDLWAYMLVAEGAADVGGLDPDVRLWDLAAPLVIVEEAGGRLTDLSGVRGAGGGSGIATNGLLHEAALEIVGF